MAEADLRAVRETLERIRHCAMPSGPVECGGTWLRQIGEMRMGPGRPWLPFEAQEWFEGAGLDFRWKASVRMAPLVTVRVLDSFQNGQGRLNVSLFGLPFVRSRGPALDKGEALRALLELPWRPYAFCETSFLRWQAPGDNQLRATFDDGRTRGTVEFDIDADGQVLRASAMRPRMVGKSLVDTLCSGVFGSYRTFQSVRIPTEGEVSWQLPDGPFTYWRGRVTEFAVSSREN